MKLKRSVMDRILQLKNCTKMNNDDIQRARQFYADKDNRDEITICMATHPPKGDLWKNAYLDLRSQCDRFILVLGGYDEIPEDFVTGKFGKDISDGKLRMEVAGKNGNPEDRGCQNKYMFYGDFPGYYCPFDDDVRYSENCMYQLIQKYEEYGRKAIVSFHGERYPTKDGEILACYGSSKISLFRREVWHGDEFCHAIGGCCTAMRPADFSFGKELFLSEPKNLGDDEIMALWAQKNEVPLIAVDNTHCLLYAQEYDRKVGLYYTHKRENHRYNVLKSYSNWHLVTCVPQKASNESN